MKMCINYADEQFKGKQIFSSLMAKYFGGFDKVIAYTPIDIDKSYYEMHKGILKCDRGGGYWLWKSYIINISLELISEGDYLFYCDAGAFFIKSVDHIINDMNKHQEDIAVFQLPLKETDYTNKYTLKYFNYDESMGVNQILGGYICIRKTINTVSFFKEYQRLCENEMLVTDYNTQKDEAHRHDQSILSLLSKKAKIKPFRDPSDYGEFPVRYYRDGFSFNDEIIRGNYPTLILSNRKENPVTYGLKYITRRASKWI